ncbi:hypothetical protein GCM10017044_04990 [Kordiimonas sediminis]|uniref:Recombinase family protein n=1 Tax=Kordiimonas sediminis TaxID=1735581 RepID=A0A919ALC0_9PROT|nr:recombinase family protein [Kordiimonas sediminis]GHF13903.1 hypothetical protein GCM10017044_04990 [Kordiimonas sediminis]
MKRVALYARVSTKRQADGDISIPDQLSQMERYAASKGWEVIASYTDRGVSGRTDNRPEFQRMVRDAISPEQPFDCILVHSLSRYSRDLADSLSYEKKLEAAGVELISITQEFSNDGSGNLMRKVTSLFDEHNSLETAKHVSRSMVENARQGFWNGSQPPFGYRTFTAEVRGAKHKKKLEIEPKEAEIVKLIFRLYLHGDGTSGPMGIKKIADTINSKSYRNRNGNKFYTSVLEKILKRETYSGTHYFNKKCSKTGKQRPREEWIAVEAPVIIDPETFQAVQMRLSANSPKKRNPRQVSNKLLLSGKGVCSGCGQGLMLMTGKNNQYRYYTCASKKLKGKSACNAPVSLPEATLDQLVLDAISEQIFDPERLRALIKETLDLSGSRQDQARQDLKRLKRELRTVDKEIDNLISFIAEGRQHSSVEKALKDRELSKENILRLIGIKERELSLPVHRLTNGQLDKICAAIQETLKNGPTAFRKAYLDLLVDRIEVSASEVRIRGSKQALAATVFDEKEGKKGSVLISDRKWRTQEDSNLWPLPSEGSALLLLPIQHLKMSQ